jgi:hypothetical protein
MILRIYSVAYRDKLGGCIIYTHVCAEGYLDAYIQGSKYGDVVNLEQLPWRSMWQITAN